MHYSKKYKVQSERKRTLVIECSVTLYIPPPIELMRNGLVGIFCCCMIWKRNILMKSLVKLCINLSKPLQSAQSLICVSLGTDLF